MRKRSRTFFTATSVTIFLLVSVACQSAAGDATGGHPGETFDQPLGADKATGWPDAVDKLVTAEAQAKSCAGRLKSIATPDEAAWWQGERLYSAARAKVNGVIAGLQVLLSESADPPQEGRLAEKLERGANDAQAFCDHVNALAERTEGEKSLRRALVENLPAVVVDALWTLVGFRGEDEQRRSTIMKHLEAALWEDFQMIEPIKR